jgi:dipeptidase
MYSENLFNICQSKGWWNPKNGTLNWVKAVSNGEFHHPYYSLRRIWRIFSIVKPSVKFNPWVNGPFTKEYPFSIVPDKKLSVKDVIAIHRDYYQGTDFDLTKGVASGAYNNPLRNECPNTDKTDLTDIKNKDGAWERSIAIVRCVYYHINQMRNSMPDPVGGVIWFGFDKPAESCVMPIYAGVTALPKPFTIGDYAHYNPKSAWWIFNTVAHYATLKYRYMIEDIKKLQQDIENNEFAMQPAIEETALNLIKNNKKQLAEKFLTEYCAFNAKSVLAQWKKLQRELYVKYNGQYVISKDGTIKLTDHSPEWLGKTNYIGNLQSYNKPTLQ